MSKDSEVMVWGGKRVKERLFLSRELSAIMGHNKGAGREREGKKVAWERKRVNNGIWLKEVDSKGIERRASEKRNTPSKTERKKQE